MTRKARLAAAVTGPHGESPAVWWRGNKREVPVVCLLRIDAPVAVAWSVRRRHEGLVGACIAESRQSRLVAAAAAAADGGQACFFLGVDARSWDYRLVEGKTELLACCQG